MLNEEVVTCFGIYIKTICENNQLFYVVFWAHMLVLGASAMVHSQDG